MAGSAAYGLGLLFYLIPGSSLLYLKITGVRTVESFGGATYHVAEGVPNPWGLLGTTYTSNIVPDARSNELTVTVQDSGYRKVN